MTFLNQTLVFGAAAFLIPLIIHVLNRSRFRTVPWGAMHLLESVIRVNHKRFRIEQLILLLVRCAIPVLLACCLARPVLTGARILDGDAPVSLVILQDTSYSMDTVNSSGTRHQQAVDAVCRLVEATNRGSEISVIQTGGRPIPVLDQPVSDPAAVVRRVRQIPGGLGASDIPAALEAAFSTLATMSHARRELIILSDFQPADWSDVREQSDSYRQQLEAMDVTPSLTLIPIGQPVPGNIAVEGLEFPDRALGVNQRLSVRVNIRNHGEADYKNARVSLRVDRVETDVSQTTLAANGVTQVLFGCQFENPGSHTIEVEVIADDRLATDNRYAAAVTVWDRIQVLLVDGDPSSQPLQGETDFLSIALTPFTFGRVRLTDLIQTETISSGELTDERLRAARVVVLANVSKLDDARLAALTRYVRDGGALFIAAGNRIDLNWYNTSFYAGGTGLLPAALQAPRGKINEQGQAARIVSQRFDHPALELFNDPQNGDLSTAEIRQWYAVDVSGAISAEPSDEPGSAAISDEPGSTAVSDEPGTATTEQMIEPRMRASAGRASSASGRPLVVARLDNGDPLLVEQQFGDGVVLFMTTACDADWSELPMRPVYVPLMQQLISTLASRISPPRNIMTGEPAVALFQSDEPTDGPLIASITTPDGARRTLQTTIRGSHRTARYELTQRPGVYSMSLPTTETVHFVAETSRSESDLHMLDAAQLKSLAEGLSAAIAPTPDDYLQQDNVRRHGREIWKYVLAALLAMMFLEVILQQRFARVPT